MSLSCSTPISWNPGGDGAYRSGGVGIGAADRIASNAKSFVSAVMLQHTSGIPDYVLGLDL